MLLLKEVTFAFVLVNVLATFTTRVGALSLDDEDDDVEFNPVTPEETKPKAAMRSILLPMSQLDTVLRREPLPVMPRSQDQHRKTPLVMPLPEDEDRKMPPVIAMRSNDKTKKNPPPPTSSPDRADDPVTENSTEETVDERPTETSPRRDPPRYPVVLGDGIKTRGRLNLSEFGIELVRDPRPNQTFQVNVGNEKKPNRPIKIQLVPDKKPNQTSRPPVANADGRKKSKNPKKRDQKPVNPMDSDPYFLSFFAVNTMLENNKTLGKYDDFISIYIYTCIQWRIFK